MHAHHEARAQPDCRKVVLGFLNAYGPDWRDACLKGNDKVGKAHDKAKPKVQKGAGRRNIQKPIAEENGAKDPNGKSKKIRVSENHIYATVI